jgi:uncharacterized membrane protein YraQ (UPF0718 family)
VSRLKQAVINNKLFTMVLAAYVLISIFIPDKAVQSFQNSLFYVKEMIMIMPVILLLTSLIKAWVPQKTIMNNFGKGSGVKGSILSFLLGSLSAGPIYAAFPLCKTLLAKGASISNIVIILCTWAVVKVPMLLNEAKFLSPKFMFIRWILTSISIFIMGYIMSKLVRKEDIPVNVVNTGYSINNVLINRKYCVGCGLCVKIAPQYFEMNNKKAKLINRDVKKDEINNLNKAIEKCPSKAIKRSSGDG